MANPVGSVTAKIILDTKEFEEAVERLKGEVKEIKESFNQKVGGNGLIDEVSKLKEEMGTLQSTINEYKTQLKSAREENTSYAKTVEKLRTELGNLKKEHSANTNAIKEERKNLDVLNRSAEQYQKIASTTKNQPARANQWVTSRSLNNAQTTIGSIKRSFETLTDIELKWQSNLTRAIDNARLGIKQYDQQIKESINLEKQRWSQTGGITGYINLINQMRQAMGRVTNAAQKELPKINNIFKQLEGTGKRLVAYKIGADGELINPQAIAKSSEVLKKFDFQVLETAKDMMMLGKSVPNFTSFEKRITALSSRIHKLSVQGTPTWEGRQVAGGYSNYISQTNKISSSLKKQAQISKEAKLATESLSQAYSKTNLNTYKANLTKINEALTQTRIRTAQLEAAQSSLYYKLAPNNLNTYKMNMDKVNQAVARQTTTTKNLTNATRTGQMSMREFGTTMGKAEAYSNNLYRGLQKVRSVIVSIKTIAAALGTMAVWGFASDLIEGAKETYHAKNEMESLLKQNTHVTKEGTDGINVFNKALDDTISRFQKINKYSLGETASSIGLEFNLNAKEMAKSLDVIAMVQSEYSRAGRSNEEAALAVKDILQGEFRRLSMETGVGEKELKSDYGWSGKKEDVLGLMEALRKAGKERHWDVFAAKANSLNDVVTITQSRFSEFGADLSTNLEPMIVGAFNGILNVVDSLNDSFNSMGSFGKITTMATTGLTAFGALSTALMMFKRNMGLVDIATLGWRKSLGTALFGLNKTDVALHGFRKTLLATITGTKASTVANNGFAKSLAGRVMGLKQTTIAERGLSTAILERSYSLKGMTLLTDNASLATMKWYQKLAVASGRMDMATAKNAGFVKSLRAIISSTKLLKIAIAGLTGGILLSALASVSAWTDRVKGYMDSFNNVVNNGKDILKSANKDVNTYTNSLAKLTKVDKDYNIVKNRLDLATARRDDIKHATELTKKYIKLNRERKKGIEDDYRVRLQKTYALAGADDPRRLASGYSEDVKIAQYYKNKALTEYDKRLYQANQHMTEHVTTLKKAGVERQDLLKYTSEYNMEAMKTAELQKKFNEGDLNSLFYMGLSELKLMWIDLWSDPHFANFWNSVNKTWNELKPTVDYLTDKLHELGDLLLDVFSTKEGQIIGTIALAGAGFGALAYKLRGVFDTVKNVGGSLKSLGDKLKQVKDGWRGVAEESKKATTNMGTSTTSPSTTGGINPKQKAPTNWKDTKGLMKQDFMANARSFANNATKIAMAMGYLTIAIATLSAPMLAIAAEGELFKRIRPQVQQGIDGLKMIAPVVISFMIPATALMLVFNKYQVTSSQMMTGFKTAAETIAMGMLLVAESIFMLNAPLLAIASIGAVNSMLGDSVTRGRQAIQLVTDTLTGLYPIIPVYAAAIGMGVIALTGIGFVAEATVIAAGMVLVAESIGMLSAPLTAIGLLGDSFRDLTSVKAGSQAIKTVAVALGYVQDAFSTLVLVKWDMLASAVTDLIGVSIGVDLTNLSSEGGFFDQLKTFTTTFNKQEFTPADPSKVASLNSASNGLNTVANALINAKKAVENIPSQLNTQYNNQYNANATGGLTGYFDQLKEPLRQLKKFIDDFNNDESLSFGKAIDQEKINSISSAANMLGQVNQAVQKVNDVMWNTGMGNTIANIGTAFTVGSLFGGEGSNSSYISGFGSQFKSIEDIITDLNTFQSRVSDKVNSKGADVSGLTSFVTNVKSQIDKLVKTLGGDRVNQAKANARTLGSSIVNGLKAGLNNLGSVGASIPSTIANRMMNGKDMVYNTANSLGNTTASKFRTGVNPMSSYMYRELDYVKSALTNRHDELGQDAYDLGDYLANQFKDGIDSHSPGLMARSISDEMGYIEGYLNGGVNSLPNIAFNLAQSLGNNFKVDFGLSNIQLPNVSQFTDRLKGITSTVGNVKTQVSTKFGEMKTNIGSAFSNIVTNTRTNMGNMLSATTKNIGSIRTSWKGMQSALIASAENIKTQTGNKINTLKTNLGNFWNKLKHPDQLITGSAGGHTGSIRRRHRPKLFAGGTSSSPSSNDSSFMKEYLKCLMGGNQCYAGGWKFNWNKPIQNKFNGWNTNFGKYNLDKFLKVGKFAKSDFPINELAENQRAKIAKQYIFDTINATKYDKYFDSHFGDDPVAALRAGAFNCWDGTNIILSIARAFGFNGDMGHGTWNGIGHVWAEIPGLGVIDPTAIQQRGTFKSSAVKGYSAGGSVKRHKSSGDNPMGTTIKQGDINIHIHEPIYGIEDFENTIEKSVKKLNRKLFTNKFSGV